MYTDLWHKLLVPNLPKIPSPIFYTSVEDYYVGPRNITVLQLWNGTAANDNAQREIYICYNIIMLMS